ncbi:hypothetical protein, partial [Nocardia sp. NPDC052112]|uniref:hypothetical protein n=1 Tax=Nocardia sp. NPDC052112 TaxID=3155646 RepID=UPI0034386019
MNLARPRRAVCCVFGSAFGAACSRPPGVSRPSRRDSRLRRMRFDAGRVAGAARADYAEAA